MRSLFHTLCAFAVAAFLAATLVQAAPRAAKKKAPPVISVPALDESIPPVDRAVDVFVAGKGNEYKSIRIPCIVNAGGGLLVAVAEGRYENTDQGRNDLIVSVSRDGVNWSKPVVAAASKGATFNNPCLIYDPQKKGICLFFQRYPKGVKERDQDIPTGHKDRRCIRNFVCASRNGTKWSRPKDVTATTKHADVTITCSGPNPGVCLTRGKYKGRLCVPLNEGPFGNWTLAVAYSDNNGKSWSIGQKSASDTGVNEVSMVETEDGGLFIVSRSWGGITRKIAYSTDGGETWGPVTNHKALPSPNCQNGLTRYSFSTDEALGGRNRILFSSPSTERRTNGIIKMSYNDGKTWRVSKSLGAGPFGYSTLCTVAPGIVGLLYESNGVIRFTMFSIKWLTDGKDSGLAPEEISED